MKYTEPMNTWNTPATDESIQTTIDALKQHHITASVVENRADALSKIKNMIPSGVSVMNGASVTLHQIGFTDYLKSGEHPWNNLHASILAEQDKQKQATLRRQSSLSDYYLGSVHAVTETGELVIGSNTGSQLSHIVYTSPHLIFVVGSQKIVPNVTEGLKRLEEYVVPLEDKRLQDAMGFHTMLSKILIIKQENPSMGRTVELILVKESLGY